jgi:hypothetical protein
MKDEEVPIDAAGLLWYCACKHAKSYLSGNLLPALIEWTQALNYFRSICQWKQRLYLDGMNNPYKEHENERRRQRRVNAADDDDHARITNTPEYLAKAAWIAKHVLNIPCFISKEEADPHVAYVSILKDLVPVTGDSDLLAYGAKKLIVVQSYARGWYRVIDLDADVEPGEYPLFDLYLEHKTIIFQLYAACRGCDFTEQELGINGIGYGKFMEIASRVEEEFNANSFAMAMWSTDDTRQIAIQNGMDTPEKIQLYLQRIVDIYSNANVYDEKSNTVSTATGDIVEAATEISKQHMAGSIDTKTQQQHSNEVMEEMNKLTRENLLHQTAIRESNIRGAKLPDGMSPEDCTVQDLRDFIIARGGKASITKTEAVSAVKRLLLIEGQSPTIQLVDRNPDPNGLMYASVDASGQLPIRVILEDMMKKASKSEEDKSTYNLIRETYQLYEQGLFDDQYDNIARVAPELKEGLIYKSFGNIGSNVNCKNIGDAFRRCLYNEDSTSYHGIAFVPDSNRVIILSKAHASMARDEKTRTKTGEYEPPEKQQYCVILEMIYNETNDIEHKHSLGVFVEMKRSYCGACVAGQGLCRHKPERLWHQFHHWTDERHGIDRPSTVDVCSWAPGGQTLESDVKSKIHELQCVKHCTNIEDQQKKMERGVKRNATEGNSSEYQVHRCAQKQKPGSERFSPNRPCIQELYELIRNDE